MLKKNKSEDKEEGAAWMATYSDMVTLLFAFFVLMFAISNVDAQKFALLAAGLSKDGLTAERFLQIQEEHEVMEGVGDPDPNDIQYPGPEDEANKPTDPETGEPVETTEPTSEGEGEDEEMGKGNRPIDRLYRLIFNYIEENELHTSIELTYNDDKILLVLANDIWFVSGSAEITAAMHENVAVLAKLLSDTHSEDEPFDVIIAGHTDNVPMNTPRYPSNWDLSVDRAVQFLRLLIEESGLYSGYFSARGYGEEEPIGDNNTEEGKQRNRRVEVLIAQAVIQ